MAMTNSQPSTRIVTVGSDYTDAPGGRYIKDGEHSGEDFREHVLVPALSSSTHVTVYLDGTVGYAGSFLEEAFGGLIRESKIASAFLAEHLTVDAKDKRYDVYVRMVQQYLKDASSSAKKSRVA